MGVALFSVASGLGGLSPGFHWLIMCRLAQGVGGALMLGVAPKLICPEPFPKESGASRWDVLRRLCHRRHPGGSLWAGCS